MEDSNGGWAMGVKPTRGHYVKRWRTGGWFPRACRIKGLLFVDIWE